MCLFLTCLADGCAFRSYIAVIVDNFNRIRKKLIEQDEGGTATMTSDQQKWSKSMIQYLANSDRVKKIGTSHAPTGPMRRIVYDLVTSAAFESLIFIVIALNVMLMASDYWQIEHDPFYRVYTDATSIFIHIYYAECILKIIGMGQRYFQDKWCQLDFFLVLTALLDEFAQPILTALGADAGSTQLLRVMRTLRIVRIVRLLKGAKQLKKLLLTLMLTLQPLLNVSALLALLVFVYAVTGVQMFTFVRHGTHLGADNNFDSIGHAAMLLFQCLTGDGWALLMVDASIRPESGRCSEEAGDCGSHLAIPYFVSFQIIGAFVFLNLVVAVMIESFTELGEAPDHTEEVVEVWHDLTLSSRVRVYVRALRAANHPDAKLADIDERARERLRDHFQWNVFEALRELGLSADSSAIARAVPEFTRYPDDFGNDIWTIRSELLRDMVLRLPPPIGLMGLVASHTDANKLCFKLRLTHINGRVAFREVLAVLLQAKPTADEEQEQRQAMALPQSEALPPPGAFSVQPADTASLFATDTIRKHLRVRNGRSNTAEREAFDAQRRKRLATIRKNKQTHGVAEHQWRSDTSGVFFPVGPVKQRWDGLVMMLVLYSVRMRPSALAISRRFHLASPRHRSHFPPLLSLLTSPLTPPLCAGDHGALPCHLRRGRRGRDVGL